MKNRRIRYLSEPLRYYTTEQPVSPGVDVGGQGWGVPLEYGHPGQMNVRVVDPSVEQIADPLCYQKHSHQRQAVRDVAGGLDQDHSQADGHSHRPTWERTPIDYDAFASF